MKLNAYQTKHSLTLLDFNLIDYVPVLPTLSKMTKFKWKILGKRDNNHYISMANNDEAKLYFAGFKNGIVLS
jgi:hypothetical protein